MQPIAPYTSWKIGGPADALANVESEAELALVMRRCFKRRFPGSCSAVAATFSSATAACAESSFGLAGAFADVTVDTEDAAVVVEAGASASMASLTARAASAGAIGIGSLAGIPGTVGGSLRMNAGTDREMGDFVKHVWVQSPSKPEPHAVSVQYFYRHTTLARDAVVSRVTMRFERGDPRAVREEMQTRLVRRKNTQPIALPNAGSCFRNPDGDKAARLIEAADAKGWRAGGAEVSPLHANFINNVDGASAKTLRRCSRAFAEP